jgi:hypothetical protein
MKKINVCIILAILISLTGFSQARFGLLAGGHLGTVSIEDDGKEEPGKKSNFGFRFGAIAQIPISDQFSFMPGLNYVSKGGKYELNEVENLGGGITMTTTGEQKITTSFIEVPLNFAYTGSSDQGGFFAGLGPVISLGISGKFKGNQTITTVIPGFPTQTSSADFDADIKFDGKKDATDDKIHLKGLEFGGNIFAGYMMSNGLFVKALYNTGFANLSPEDKTSFKTSYFGISIGFLFGSSSNE